MRANLAIAAIALFVLLCSNVHAKGFVGAEKCKHCHAKVYELWSQHGHAHAQENLPKSKKNELRCLFCHATDARKKLKSFQLSNVQCEACHGPGERHAARAARNAPSQKVRSSISRPTEKQCRNCHSDVRAASLRPFDFQKGLQVIQHWGDAIAKPKPLK